MEGKQYCTYSVRMPITLRRQLDRLAEEQDRTPSQVVRRLIQFAYADEFKESPPIGAERQWQIIE